MFSQLNSHRAFTRDPGLNLQEGTSFLLSKVNVFKNIPHRLNFDEVESEKNGKMRPKEIQITERNDVLFSNQASDDDLDSERKKLKYPSYENIAKAINFYTVSLHL